MELKISMAAVAVGLGLAAMPVHATTITFEDLAEGTVLSNQYAGLGVVFSANAFSGSGGATGDWATNTDMTIVSSTGSDVGGLGSPSLVSGNILRSFNGWLGEDGDASFLMTFTTPVSMVGMTFAGVSDFATTGFYAYDGATQIGSVFGTAGGQYMLSFAAASITSVAVVPGNWYDWVGVDNITFTQVVPEPASYLMLVLGVGTLLLKRRRG